jgi:phosphoadenosine phosphosulfate reductase
MLIEKHIDGYIRDKVAIAIDRLRAFEPPEGYYLAFSGGKDSQCIYHLAVEAGVKFDAHYNVTGIDPPELIYFMRENYPDVVRDKYKLSMWKLIEKLGLPMRQKRFCCLELKEHGGEGRICLTGVRWAESVNRKKRRPFEIVTKKKEDKKLFNDNEEGRRLFENCMQKGKRVVNPIIDWTDEDVWEYLNNRRIKHCILYDKGDKRLGCIGCPMGGAKGLIDDFKKYPKFKILYTKAVARHLEYRKRRGLKIYKSWSSPEAVIEWWINEVENIDYTDSFLEEQEND